MFTRLLVSKDQKKDFEQVYNETCEFYDQGTIKDYQTGDRDFDHKSGENFNLEIDKWHPYWVKIDFKNRTKQKVENLDFESVTSIQVTFKTKEILISDWFRIEEFTNSVELEDQYSQKFNINSSMGKQETCKAHWEQHGFLTVNLGNTSPRIFNLDGSFVFGSIDQDWEQSQYEANPSINTPVPIGTKEIGSICTDIWAVTIVEKSRLVAIVAERVGVDKALCIVNDYIDKYKNSIVSVNIEPGDWYLYWSGDYQSFKDNFKTPDLEIPDSIQPKFVLANKPLDLVERFEHQSPRL